jgi:hypothetical protein
VRPSSSGTYWANIGPYNFLIQSTLVKRNMVERNFVLSGTVPLLFRILIQVSMVKRNFEICKRNIPEILAGVQNDISLAIASVSNCRQPMRRQQ